MSKSKRPFRFLLPLVFSGGLLLGWLVIGWWLWPVQWINVSPAQLSAEHQRIYVAMAAEAYDLTGDVAQAQSRLAAWDDESLAATLTLLIQDTADPQARERYVALGEAMAMPQVDLNLMDVILGQKAILITAVAAVGLFVAALGMALFPMVQQARIRKQEERRLLAGAEAEADMDEDEQTAVSTPNAARQNNGGTETAANTAQGASPDPAANASQQANPGNPASAGDPANAGGGGAGQPGAVQAGDGKQTPPNPANAATPPTEQPATAVQTPTNAAAPAANQPPPEETAEKLLTEATGEIQALLNGIFDEDDKLAHYDTLLQGLGDVNMVQLADRSAQMLRQLRQKNREMA
jgi:cytoskeletal protein RodZ